MKALKARENIWWVGALDPDIRVFDIVMHTEYGTTYNSYVVKGKEKTVLIETVKESFFKEHLEKISQVCDVKDIDYIVFNHTEPDHTGALKELLKLAPNAVVLCSMSAVNFLKEILNEPFEYRIVSEKDEIDIGGMTLKFFSVPLLHWPDTMFTYIPEAKSLFTCDAFGCHYSDPKVFNDEIEGDFYDAYKYYFDNIMGPFKHPYVTNALDKIENLDIEFVGNGHGPVLRKDVSKYFDLYRQWSVPKAPSDKSVAVCYVSAYGYTRMLADEIVKGLKAAGVKNISSFDLVSDSMEEAKAQAAQADGILLGSPTLVGDALPPVYEMLAGLNPIIHGGKYASAFGSYGWSGEGVPNLMARMKQLKFITPLDGFRVRFRPSEQQLKEAFEYGRHFGDALLTGKKTASMDEK